MSTHVEICGVNYNWFFSLKQKLVIMSKVMGIVIHIC
jgi:hypothetical protein